MQIEFCTCITLPTTGVHIHLSRIPLINHIESVVGICDTVRNTVLAMQIEFCTCITLPTTGVHIHLSRIPLINHIESVVGICDTVRNTVLAMQIEFCTCITLPTTGVHIHLLITINRPATLINHIEFVVGIRDTARNTVLAMQIERCARWQRSTAATIAATANRDAHPIRAVVVGIALTTDTFDTRTVIVCART